MNVPLLDLKAQLAPIREELHKAVLDVIDSTQYIMGAKVEELETKVAAYVGVKHAIGLSSGTDALLIGLMALDIGPGDLVLTTPYSFFATAGAVARLNATPVFVDIDPETYNICPEALRAWFDKNPDKASKVKAIIPVHLYGQCADMKPILALGKEKGIPIIEDGAQAIGSRYPLDGAVKSSCSMAEMGCFSFFPSKNLGCAGDGGMIVSNDDAIAAKLRKLRVHGSQPKYYHSLIGGNFRLDPIQAAVLLVKLPHLESWHAARQKNAAYYDEHLNVKGVVKPHIAYERAFHIYNQYVISVPDRRDECRNHLNAKKIGNEVYYPVPFHQQECFAYLGHKPGEFPKSEYAAQHTIALPIYPELTSDMQDYVIAALAEFYG